MYKVSGGVLWGVNVFRSAQVDLLAGKLFRRRRFMTKDMG